MENPVELPRTVETTRLLRAWADGNPAALEALMPRVYKELRRIAGHCMQNERAGRTIETTALVHEAYLKLIDVENVNWQHRAHFYAVSARTMRRILPDWARRRTAGKRGGNAPAVNLDEIPDISSARARELIALDDALQILAGLDPRKSAGDRIAFLRWLAELGGKQATP